MKKRQKKSNLGQLVLTCTDLEDLHQQLKDDTELMGEKLAELIDKNCNWRSPYDQEVLINALTSVLACITDAGQYHRGVRRMAGTLQKQE